MIGLVWQVATSGELSVVEPESAQGVEILTEASSPNAVTKMKGSRETETTLMTTDPANSSHSFPRFTQAAVER